MIDINDSLAKGHIFEDYVGAHFCEKNYQLLNNRSDRRTGGHFPSEARDPDLEWLARSPRAKFAVECKYRSAWRQIGTDDRFLELGGVHKLQHYVAYATRTNQPVFVIFGVKGTPDEPDEIFIVPLEQIRGDRIFHADIARWRSRHPRGYFEYRNHSWRGTLYQRKEGPLQPSRAPLPSFSERQTAPVMTVDDYSAPAQPPLLLASHAQTFASSMGHSDTASVSPCPLDSCPTLDSSTPSASGVTARRWLLLALGAGALGLYLNFRPTPPVPPLTTVKVKPLPVRTSQAHTPPSPVPIAATPQPTVAPSAPVSPPAQPTLPTARLLVFSATKQPFQLTIERTQPTPAASLRDALSTGLLARRLYATEHRPKYFAIELPESDAGLPLGYYLIFDTETGTLISTETYVVAQRQPVKTHARLARYECLFINAAWVQSVTINTAP